jgi:deoxyribodipyrimidine photolyase-like uncharacterized protein
MIPARRFLGACHALLFVRWRKLLPVVAFASLSRVFARYNSCCRSPRVAGGDWSFDLRRKTDLRKELQRPSKGVIGAMEKQHDLVAHENTRHWN